MVKTFSRKNDGATRITPHFFIREFGTTCSRSCCVNDDNILLDTRLPDVLERVRALCGGKAINISSSYRNQAHNTMIGSGSGSFHTKGQAADITINGVDLITICRAAETALHEAKIPGGIILYTAMKFVHIDTRPTRYRGINDGTLKNASGWDRLPTSGTPAPTATPVTPSTSNPSTPFKPYNVRVTGIPLNIRSAPGTNNPIIGSITRQSIEVTIIEEAAGTGATKWGKIKQGQAGASSGWISLDHTTKI